MKKCNNYWKGNKDTEENLKNAIEQINKPTNFVLRASDFFTTGLSEPYNSNSWQGWNSLIKVDGGANKTGDSAGSFGIGKNAPFANSHYRLVFYRTLNKNFERAAQGVARLVTFKQNGELTTGMGYFGNPDKNQPVEKVFELDDIHPRPNKKKYIGTDIFIFGFNGSETWRDDVYIELIENFLMSVDRGNLRVQVQNENEKDWLEKSSLEEFILRYNEGLTNAKSYYKVLQEKDKVKIFTANFHELGEIKLSVLVDEKENLNRKVLIVRKSGMKIFDMDRISRSISFTGILEIEGTELNDFFRQMENPEHNKWEEDRHKDPKLARKYLKELKDWVRDSVRSLGEQVTEAETNVQGLGSMLRFNSAAVNAVQQNKTLERINSQVTAKIISAESVEETLNKILLEKGDGNFYNEKVNGIIQDGAENSAIRTLKGIKKRKNKAIHTGIEDSEGKDIVTKPTGKFIECRNRIIKTGEKNYRLIVTTPKNVSKGTVKIFAVGEDEDSEVEELKILKFQTFQGGIKSKIDFEIENGGKYTYALRAYIYENDN